MNNLGSPEERKQDDQTPLARFVREKLAELHIRQTEFCRLTGFDQGLLSKIQNSMVSTLSLESALKLAVGLRVAPRILLELIGRPDLNELVLRAYGRTAEDPESSGGPNSRGEHGEVRPLAEKAPGKVWLRSRKDPARCSFVGLAGRARIGLGRYGGRALPCQEFGSNRGSGDSLLRGSITWEARQL